MRLSPSLVALASASSLVHAFKDTSSLILFSSSPIPARHDNISTNQLQTKSEAIADAKKFLSTCPSQFYYVISQPGVSPRELASSASHLKKALADPSVQYKQVVSEVVGLDSADADDLDAYIRSECGAMIVHATDVSAISEIESSSLIVMETYPSIPSSASNRAELIADTDASLYPILSELPNKSKYTFIYVNTPAIAQEVKETERNEVVSYQPNFDEVMHMDLKRSLEARKGNTTERDRRPLFEKYEFFNPGLFMGLLVSLLLLSILSVGMSALGSLQVSYGAFDKEMGPAAHKKQQ